MMKRRILSAALSAALILSLAACGGGNSGASSSAPGGGSGSGQVDASAPDTSRPGGNGRPDGSQPDAPDTGTGGSNSGSTAPQITLTLNRNNIELNKSGATFQLRYTVDPDIYDGLAEFTSSDTNVATVDMVDGTVTAVAPGKATITVKCPNAVGNTIATAMASVNCNWTESKPEEPKPEEPKPEQPKPEQPKPEEPKPEQPTDPPAPSNVDLSAFYSTITGKYEFAMLELADDGILDNFYPGVTGIGTEQRLIYVCAMSMNNGEIGLVQVKDSKDVDAVKAIFQARIDAQASGGAWYPQAVDSWTNNARVVSNGSYVMMVVHENCDDIVNEFNALF